MTDRDSTFVPAGFLKSEDYEEPCCPLNMGQKDGMLIPVRRVMEKLDWYLAGKDHAGAERHLNYWLAEADEARDDGGKLAILNEQIGLYRKLGKEKECMTAIAKTLGLTDLEADDTVTCATTLINIATGYKAFGHAEEALPLYRRAREIYEIKLPEDDGRRGGLYNNMALALAETGEYREAETLYRKAIEVMKQQEYGEAETAITYLNLADLKYDELGAEESEAQVAEYLEEAEKLLDTETLPQNGYYAFVCEKCAPVFGYYGWFMTESKLMKRANGIYERA